MRKTQSVLVAHAIVTQPWCMELAAQLSMIPAIRNQIFLCTNNDCIDLVDLTPEDSFYDEGDVVEIYFEDADTNLAQELVRLIESPLLIAG